MLDFSQSELGALHDLLQHFHPDLQPSVIEERIAYMTKGCKFHWLQQVERVAKALEKGAEEVQRIKDRFTGLAEIASQEQVLKAMEDHLREYPQSKDWVKFWTRPSVRRMTFQAFSEVSAWDKLPTTNNIVLRIECSSKSYSMVIKNLWQCDHGSFLSLAAADMGVSRRWDAASSVAQEANNVKRLKSLAEQRSRLSRGRPKDRSDEFDREARRLRAKADENASVEETVTDGESEGDSDSVVVIGTDSGDEDDANFSDADSAVFSSAGK